MNSILKSHMTLCTFFDVNFLTRGVALYYSLVEHYPNFTLWILCGDDKAFEALTKLNLNNVKLLKISEVEDARMLAIKSTRTPIEYIWLFGSQLPLYLLEKTKVDMVTFLDADMFFFSSPEKIYEELGNKSILLIPHRYSQKNLDRIKTSGIYNVGMMVFRNDPSALECLNWWKDRCIEWCFNRYEDGKFGDQLYLNDWPTRFKNVHTLKNIGANVAPWNIKNYKFNKKEISVKDKNTGEISPLIFYHFHAFKIYIGNNDRIRPYPITIYEINIYKRYLEALQKAYKKMLEFYPKWDYGTVKKLDIFRVIKQYVSIYIIR